MKSVSYTHLSKTAGEDADYLSKDREYRCEKNVFEDYDLEQRDAVFGEPPATVWENVRIMRANPDKVASITRDDVISKDIVESFIAASGSGWQREGEISLPPIPYTLFCIFMMK